ncbi:KpsF/GutQ family protein [Frateuria aurantia DSM 6220]|uniref:Arabinose 5-phosphate isomerase n=2 Tax=Frateuria aurantia TaxID=81475 RepID=H8L4Z8_FRAAD|nr:KpsF/GutQ family protein [Frateuria aurantia DSM 6220]
MTLRMDPLQFMAPVDDRTIIENARRVILTEAASIQSLADRVEQAFAAACRLILECQGRIVVSGMGKSGHVARKIAATLASTGTPAFFVHPGEASHGDLGMVQPHDVMLLLSNSGETDELLFILPFLKRQGTALIAMTGHAGSALARQADIHLDAAVETEACPLGLAPTTSTTAAMVLGDALAVALLEARGFTADDFARSHPAGNLGRRLLVRISDVMHSGEALPRVRINAKLSEALMEMSRTRLGITAVIDDAGILRGVFSDGDLRRVLDDHRVDLREAEVGSLMSRTPITIGADQLASEAARMMEQHQVHALLVVNTAQQLVGALNIHDLLRARVV